ncbi:hypothetical protein [Pseudomonas sp. TMP25]|uniref:hypothetical protein n=1 Tax=Pseudomonas sp. TMP25 TaxID=3136561 RepID=UPI003100EB01
MQLLINNWATVLTAPATSAATTLSVAPAQAAKLAGIGAGDYYLLTLAAATDGVETAWEIVKLTGATGSALTVVRGWEGTTAAAWPDGVTISARATAGTLASLGGATPEQGALADSAVQPGELSAVATSGAYADLSGRPMIPTTAAQVGAIPATEKGAPSGLATLDGASKIPLAQLPATAITDTSVVASQAAMLALSAQVGDVAIRTDISSSFILRAEPATTLGNWQALLSPASGGGAAVGSSSPQPLGVATPGVSGSASREDHAHPMPSAADVSATPASHAGTGGASHASAVAGGAAGFMTGSDKAKLDGVSANPMTAAGDIVVGGASGTPARLAKGGALQVLRMNAAGTAQEYADPSGGSTAPSPTITDATTARTLGLADANAYIRVTNVAASTVTVPPQASVAWLADTEVHIRRAAAGNLTIAAGAGVSLNAPSRGTLVMTDRMSVTLKRVGTDVWDVIGQVVPV